MADICYTFCIYIYQMPASPHSHHQLWTPLFFKSRVPKPIPAIKNFYIDNASPRLSVAESVSHMTTDMFSLS